MIRLFLIFVSIAITLSSPFASACSVMAPERYDGSAAQQENVRIAIDAASAIIDGEVIRPMTSERTALVRVHKIYKGTVPEVIEIGVADSCSYRLDRMSERLRMVLSGGPQLYTIYGDQSEAELEDEILGSDRQKVWPYFGGDEPQP